MNVMRVQQIIESSEEIVVNYNGTPVWIQNVDENSETARVYTREKPDDELTVPIHELVEQ